MSPVIALDPGRQNAGVDLGGLGGKPELGGVAHRRMAQSAGRHGLRRDAVPEMGGTTDDLLLDQRDPSALRCRRGGSLGPSRAAADDDQMSPGIAHVIPSSSCRTVDTEHGPQTVGNLTDGGPVSQATFIGVRRFPSPSAWSSKSPRADPQPARPGPPAIRPIVDAAPPRGPGRPRGPGSPRPRRWRTDSPQRRPRTRRPDVAPPRMRRPRSGPASSRLR